MRLPDSARSRAVLIGTFNYASDSGFDSLPGVAQNLIGFEELLRTKTGLQHVRIMPNPPDGKAFADALDTAIEEAEDVLLFYYAGHGVVVRGDLALTCADSRIKRAGYTTVLYSQIRDDIRTSRAAIKIIILDCCHSGRAFGDGTMGGDENEVLKDLAEISGAYVLTATDTKSKFAAASGPDGYTGFTGMLLDVLRSGDPRSGEFLTMDSMFPLLTAKLRSANLPLPRSTGRDTASALALARNERWSSQGNTRPHTEFANGEVEPTLDLIAAIQFGQLVEAVYNIPPDDLTNRGGFALSVGGTDYTVVTTVYANDLAADTNASKPDVAIGLICQGVTSGDVVVAIRGTEGILEWIHDVNFLLVPCPFLAAGGHTDDGFTGMYQSVRTDVAADPTSLVKEIGNLAFPQPVGAVTVCGHSLGGALATLLALDLTANGKAPFNHPAVYTYGSPRMGDLSFAATYNQAMMNSHRIANRFDTVSQAPPSGLYEHVTPPYELNPIQLRPLPPRVLVANTMLCEHSLNTYLHLLSLQSGGPVIPLAAPCQP